MHFNANFYSMEQMHLHFPLVLYNLLLVSNYSHGHYTIHLHTLGVDAGKYNHTLSQPKFIFFGILSSNQSIWKNAQIEVKIAALLIIQNKKTMSFFSNLLL